MTSKDCICTLVYNNDGASYVPNVRMAMKEQPAGVSSNIPDPLVFCK